MRESRRRAQRPYKVVAVALANKMAWIIWALLAKGGTYRNNWGAMQIQTDTKVSLCVRDGITGRLAFNPKAIEALGLSPTELTQRGYPLDGDGTDPANVPEDRPASVSANG